MKPIRKKSKVGRPKSENPGVKKCLCIPGRVYKAVVIEAGKRSEREKTRISELQVIYSILEEKLL